MAEKKLEIEEEKIDQAKLLEMYDTESRFRKFDSKSTVGIIVFLVSVMLSLFHLYTAWQGTLPTLMHRSIHVGIIMSLVFILYPAGKKSKKDKPSVFDWGLSLISLGLGAYILLNYNAIVLRAGLPNNVDVFLGIVSIIVLLEGARRIVGKEIVILAIVFLLYAYFGRKLPGIIAHRGYSIKAIAEYMYLSI